MHSVRVCVLALVAFGFAPSAVRAQSTATRAIVLTFEGGRQGAQAREAVLFALQSHVELVTEDQAIETAQAMGIDVGSPGGLAEVVEELRVGLVVTGGVRGRGRNARTELVVVDPQGEELARLEAPGPRTRRARAEIERAAIEVVDAAMAAREAQNAPEPEPEPQGPIIYDDEGPSEREEEDDDDEIEGPRWRHPLLLARVGVRIRSVSTSVDEEATNTRFFFDADMFPELELAVQVRPLTDAEEPLARGLILGVDGGVSVGIQYLDVATDELRTMTSFRFRADVGYGFTFGNVFELQGLVGFGMEGVDLEAPTVFPSTFYTYLRPAVVGRVDLFRRVFLLEGGVGGRIGLDGGPLSGAFGPNMSWHGVDVWGGFSGIVAPGFAWGASFGYTFHVLGFDGDGGTFGDGGPGRDETLEIRLLVGAAL